MTVIVAARTEADGVVMASDSQTVDEYVKETLTEAKIWSEDGYIFGGCGDIRFMQVLRYFTIWPKRAPEKWDHGFLVTEVIPAMQTALRDNGALMNNDAAPGTWMMEGQLIIARGDNIATLVDNFGAMISVAGLASVGTGSEVALGTFSGYGPWTREQVIKSVRQAIQHSVNVGGRVYVVTTKDPDVVRIVDEPVESKPFTTEGR